MLKEASIGRNRKWEWGVNLVSKNSTVAEKKGGFALLSRRVKWLDTHLPGITDCLVPSTQRSQWMRETAPLVFHGCPILWKCPSLFQVSLFPPDPPWCWPHSISASSLPWFKSSVFCSVVSPLLTWVLKPPMRVVFFVVTQIGFRFSIFSFLCLSSQAVNILRTRTLLGRTHGGWTDMHYWYYV